MELKTLKTVRFTQLIASSGHPAPVTLWVPPEEDREFSKATREQRVLTVLQQNTGSQRDYGLVGFFQQPLATYLVFPKKLPYPPETKVIGIKYDQLTEPTAKVPARKSKRAPARPIVRKRKSALVRRAVRGRPANRGKN